jgi:hypothetical protein
VLLITTEFEDVVLRDAEMLKEHPWRVREIFWLCTLELGWKILDGVVEGRVSLAAFQQFEEVFAEGVIGVFGHRIPFLD